MSSSLEKDHKNINKLYQQNPIGERRAELLKHKFHKNMCHFFQPFRQYYHQYKVAYILPPKPTYIQKQQFQEKMIMSSAKQCEYLRGATKHYFEEQLVQSLINEQDRNRGLFENIQKKSLYIDGLFIYASGWSVESMHLQLNKQKNHQNKNRDILGPRTFSLQFPEPVMQILLISSPNIIIRCRYWIFLYDIARKEQIGKIRLRQEVTSIMGSTNKNILLISTFKQNYYYLYQWDLHQNKINQIEKTQSFWPIHSMIYLNSREYILGFYNKIVIDDPRCPSTQTLRRVDQIGNDRFCSIAQVCKKKNELVVSRSKFIDVFDIRNPKESLLSMRHKCQQSPPSCLINLWWQQPTLIAYSPSEMGSSILMNIDTSKVLKNVSENILFKKSQNKPLLLFDSGKNYKGLHIKSMCGIVEQNLLKLIQIDSSDGISLEQLKKGKKGDQNIIRLRSKNFNQQIINYPQQPWKKWIQFKQFESYFIQQKSEIQPNQANQSPELDLIHNQSQMFKRVNNYSSLDRFRNRLHQLSKKQEKQKQSIKEGKQMETYGATLIQIEQEQSWAEILKYARKRKSNQEKISQQVLYIMEKGWEI